MCFLFFRSNVFIEVSIVYVEVVLGNICGLLLFKMNSKRKSLRRVDCEKIDHLLFQFEAKIKFCWWEACFHTTKTVLLMIESNPLLLKCNDLAITEKFNTFSIIHFALDCPILSFVFIKAGY